MQTSRLESPLNSVNYKRCMLAKNNNLSAFKYKKKIKRKTFTLHDIAEIISYTKFEIHFFLYIHWR